MDASMDFWLQNLKELIEYQKANLENSGKSHTVDIPDLGRNQIERVPPLFRNSQAHRKAYDPVIVSMGPFHHGRRQFCYAEAFKEVSLQAFLSGCSIKDPSYFHKKILGQIQEIRDSYGELNFKDGDLAWLILRDACFFIYHLASLTKTPLSSRWATNFSRYYSYFGLARIKLISRDLFLLENQIPFWIIDLLLSLKSYNSPGGESQRNELVCKYMKDVYSMKSQHLCESGVSKPFHFLGAYYQALEMQIGVDTPKGSRSTSEISFRERNPHNHRFRSITNLKGKGIHFKVTKPTEEKQILRFNSYVIFARLQLPPLVFSTEFFVLYSNLIAFEMSPTNKTQLFVSSFVIFMKSLIESSNDVKILREKGILYNDMITDDEVVKVIRDLDTFGLENVGIFSKLRDDIERHCRSKAKTWLAELIHNYFENPWKTIALLAAIFLLVLTFLQTFFTIRPTK